ncbi:class I SAM-dependent methyltransferase [Allostreptomyces psammosilenae]|uniref:Ubiquinone/menaquinone biosynthesis C-methylase UbiE n=1 Tax=Allostreptomyces psammosilenae TaxID=1892865 RepID=A0A853A9L5_9ACTN|nr:class I SAM-dependent methyltransferase [Allostreptomyces psammosilenae]NYI07311.1 ubiquinone/menaquinone biosynthesis C-methylase UbiE [Allostreptomyces psammosilenae]
MHPVVNTHQAEAWNGYEGEHWARHHDRYEAMTSGLNEPLFAAAAIAAHDHVLDVGCGNGGTTLRAARLAVAGEAVGVDLSAPMLERARATAAAEGVDNATFQQGDAQVFPFPEARFDVAISRGGVMYFADAVAAFANIARALRPGGRLAFVTSQPAGPDSEAMVPLRALAAHVPRPERAPGDNSPNLSALSDPDHARRVLRDAGFEEVTVEPFDAWGTLGRTPEEAADFVLGWGPVRYAFQQAGITDTAPARAAVATALRPHHHPEGVRLRTPMWTVTAHRPTR